MKNLPTLTGDRRGKPTDFQKKDSSFFRPFISTVLGWLASLLFGGPSGLDDRFSHGQNGINRGRDHCWLGEVFLMKLAEQLSKMLHH